VKLLHVSSQDLGTLHTRTLPCTRGSVVSHVLTCCGLDQDYSRPVLQWQHRTHKPALYRRAIECGACLPEVPEVPRSGRPVHIRAHAHWRHRCLLLELTAAVVASANISVKQAHHGVLHCKIDQRHSSHFTTRWSGRRHAWLMTILSSFSMVQQVCSTVRACSTAVTKPGQQWLCACGLRRANETKCEADFAAWARTYHT
jgi:hypothetical protein